jgi:hypothetical protein
MAQMHEIILNLHMHTTYSDGSGSHASIAEAARRAGLDVVIVTDHNIWVNGLEGFYQQGNQKVLVLVGEEIHDQARNPQKSHLLVFGANRELATWSSDPQRLIEAVQQYHGLSFLAHIVDPPAAAVGQNDLSWADWGVQGYTGIELWNGLSELKTHLKTKLHAIYYAYNFKRVARGPLPEALRRWDELLGQGSRVVAIGGSDAHALQLSLGPLRRVVYPYEDHFRAVNNHLLLPTPLSDDVAEAKRAIYEALSRGRSFIGYDLPAPTRNFRFSAQGRDGSVWMGEEISAKNGVTLQIRLPRPAECRLIKDGKVTKTWQKRDTIAHITTEPGIYRVEVYIDYLGMSRGWIFSNPIYVI